MEKVKHKFSVYFYNWTTYTGVILSLVVLTIEIFMFAMDAFNPHSSTYLGLITYIVLPPFLILGLILIPLGALRKRRRVSQGKVELKPQTYFFDPTLPSHRNGLFVFMLGSSIIILMTAVGSYKAFHYTESVKFCGQTCHGIMKPEYTTFQQSPHARIKCVECHIGEGAEHYMQAKISGARQVVQALRNSFARPIATPIHNLRPAKEICEQCHWPGKYFSSFELKKTYFPVDEYEDKDWTIRMMIRVGGSESTGPGIHAHMYNDNTIYYAADDTKRQKISWVKSVAKDGTETVYTAKNTKYEKESPPDEAVRAMDCVDCHNRPAHNYRSPTVLINEALLRGTINQQIPKVKERAMAVLSETYQTESEAYARIPEDFRKYYETKHSEYYAKNFVEVEKAASQVLSIYKLNFFPEMKARWDVYPENIGHLTSSGCFRCHDGEHKSSDGKIISRDCNICHTIVEQGPTGATEKNIDGLEFKHPFNADESWKDMSCFDCHTGN